MISRILFVAQDVAELIIPKHGWALISIRCPEDTVLLQSGWKDPEKGAQLLTLKFDDVDKFISGYQSFSYDQAEEVIRFLNKISNEPHMHTLIVHCGAGISRSAAVAMFAQENFTTIEKLHGTDNHNRLVRSMLEYKLNIMREENQI